MLVLGDLNFCLVRTLDKLCLFGCWIASANKTSKPLMMPNVTGRTNRVARSILRLQKDRVEKEVDYSDGIFTPTRQASSSQHHFRGIQSIFSRCVIRSISSDPIPTVCNCVCSYIGDHLLAVDAALYSAAGVLLYRVDESGALSILLISQEAQAAGIKMGDSGFNLIGIQSLLFVSNYETAVEKSGALKKSKCEGWH